MPNPMTLADVWWLRRHVTGDRFTPPQPQPQPSGRLAGWDQATSHPLPDGHPSVTTAHAALAIYQTRGHEIEAQASHRLARDLTSWLEDQATPQPEDRARRLATLHACDLQARQQAMRAANPPHPCPACGQPLPAYRPPGLCQPCGDTFEFITREAAAKQTVHPDGRTRRQAVQAWAASRTT